MKLSLHLHFNHQHHRHHPPVNSLSSSRLRTPQLPQPLRHHCLLPLAYDRLTCGSTLLHYPFPNRPFQGSDRLSKRFSLFAGWTVDWRPIFAPSCGWTPRSRIDSSVASSHSCPRTDNRSMPISSTTSTNRRLQSLLPASRLHPQRQALKAQVPKPAQRAHPQMPHSDPSTVS